MTIAAPHFALQQEDYIAIESALMETARGRAFLVEYGRRLRALDRGDLAAALSRIEARLDALGAPPKVDAVPIIERLDKLAWTLRERGVEDFVCAKIDSLSHDLAWGGVVMDLPVVSKAAEIPAEEANSAGEIAEVAPVGLVRRQPDQTPGEPCVPTTVAAAEAASEPLPIVFPAAEVAIDEPPVLDPRLEALLWLDRMPLLDRMALFA